MNGIPCPDLPSCASIQTQVDSALGYPKAGVDIGAGLHALPTQSITTTYAAPVPLVSAGQYGYPVDVVNTPALTAPQVSQVTTLAIAVTPLPTQNASL